jgi:hypothetical protein
MMYHLISLAKLHAAKRKPGYIEAVMAVSEPVSETHVRVTAEDFDRLRSAYALPDATASSHAYSPGTEPPKPGVSLITKARNFAASAAKHVASGMPQATEEQVAARFAICQGCEHFDGKACRKCGCPVVREKKFLSKLSWAGESCPVGKWGPVSS